ncbi:MAG: LysR family transcriptional regulator [Microcella sp.]|uniref:LysR substrate-binding domain-containing protein n=1 Tax=Microcella sp. TaxID=1913979 RepID=UPI0024C67460|nr:LysR substrate-binding domain-containing protein [Microcella sp.]UYN84430.1 MAG: LysR family transcriptional regulator [Microcella sp.]
MPDPLAVAFVPGVTPGKWQRIWRERRPRGRLDLVAMHQDAALASLDDGTVHMALLRDVSADDARHAIALYRESPVVVAPKGSLVASLDSVSLAELAEVDDVTVLPVDLISGSGADAVELVAANVGVAVMPQSVARAHSRRDVVARPLTDGVETGISLVWPTAGAHPLVDEFIGIVRGRTPNSSR